MHHCIPRWTVGQGIGTTKGRVATRGGCDPDQSRVGGSQIWFAFIVFHAGTPGSRWISAVQPRDWLQSQAALKEEISGRDQEFQAFWAARIEVNLYPKYPTSSGFAGQARWCRSAAFTCGSHPDSSKRWPTTHVTCSSTRYIEIFCVRVIYVMGIICWVVTTDMQILKRDACNLCRIGFL